MAEIVAVCTIPSEGQVYTKGRNNVADIRRTLTFIKVVMDDGSMLELPRRMCCVVYGFSTYASPDPSPKTSDHKEDQPETPE